MNCACAFKFGECISHHVIVLLYMVMQPKSGVYTVGDFMTKKEDLQVVKPSTTVDEGI